MQVGSSRKTRSGSEPGNDFFQYVLNDPLDSIDPQGLDTTVIIIYDKGVGGITYVFRLQVRFVSVLGVLVLKVGHLS
jgi:hypothetical protein